MMGLEQGRSIEGGSLLLSEEYFNLNFFRLFGNSEF